MCTLRLAAADSGSPGCLIPGEPHPPATDGPAGPDDPARSSAPDLARELTGDLPCIGCGYNLRSISVLGVCPECATPVRATILARVDPYAGVLRPILLPRLTGVGLMMWSVGALGAAMATWAQRLADAVEVVAGTSIEAGRFITAGVLFLLVSAVGAGASLIRPHSGIPARHIAFAASGVLAYIPLVWIYWTLHGVYDPPRVRPYLDELAPDGDRALLRMAGGVLMLIIVMGLRPNLRLLAARSLLLRMGRVERQTMIGVAGAIGVAILGDLLHLFAVDVAPQLRLAAFLIGVLLIALGSMLITVGIVGIIIDCLRILPVVLRPPISYRQVLGNPGGDETGTVNP